MSKQKDEIIETEVEETGAELIITHTAPVVAGNFDTIKQDLEQTLQSYNLILSRETVKDGKAAAAHLNKMKAAIKLKEKAALTQIMSPVEGFREKVAELITLVDDTRDKITEQVKAYEEKTKEEIRVQLKEYRELKLNSEELYEPYRTIEIEDLVLLGSQTKTGNLTGRVMETINGRVSENKTQQMAAEQAEKDRKAAEEARIQAEVEKRAEENRIEEERKAKQRADEEIQRRTEEIQAKEREEIAAKQKEQQERDHQAHLRHQATPADIPEEYAAAGQPYDTPTNRRAAQEEINKEIEDHENGIYPSPEEAYRDHPGTPAPEHNKRTGEVTPAGAVSVYFELKVDTGGASPAEAAKFIREWIASKSEEIGSEVQRIGVTNTDGTISWNA